MVLNVLRSARVRTTQSVGATLVVGVRVFDRALCMYYVQCKHCGSYSGASAHARLHYMCKSVPAISHYKLVA
jgi:hypothetical protein